MGVIWWQKSPLKSQDITVSQNPSNKCPKVCCTSSGRPPISIPTLPRRSEPYPSALPPSNTSPNGARFRWTENHLPFPLWPAPSVPFIRA
jgi:hypothetical protein